MARDWGLGVSGDWNGSSWNRHHLYSAALLYSYAPRHNLEPGNLKFESRDWELVLRFVPLPMYRHSPSEALDLSCTPIRSQCEIAERCRTKTSFMKWRIHADSRTAVEISRLRSRWRRREASSKFCGASIFLCVAPQPWTRQPEPGTSNILPF